MSEGCKGSFIFQRILHFRDATDVVKITFCHLHWPQTSFDFQQCLNIVEPTDKALVTLVSQKLNLPLVGCWCDTISTMQLQSSRKWTFHLEQICCECDILTIVPLTYAIKLYSMDVHYVGQITTNQCHIRHQVFVGLVNRLPLPVRPENVLACCSEAIWVPNFVHQLAAEFAHQVGTLYQLNMGTQWNN